MSYRIVLGNQPLGSSELEYRRDIPSACSLPGGSARDRPRDHAMRAITRSLKTTSDAFETANPILPPV